MTWMIVRAIDMFINDDGIREAEPYYVILSKGCDY